MTIETPESNVRPPGRWRWALIASLALNLLLVGLIAGGVWRARHHGFPGLGGDFGLMGFVRELPYDHQPAIREHLQTERKNLRPLRGDVREAWSAANGLLTAEPFDKEKFKAAMAKSRELTAKFEEAVSGILAETAAKLTPDERKSLQAWRDRHKPKLFGHHERHGSGGSKSAGERGEKQ